jgi:hypothetical protein
MDTIKLKVWTCNDALYAEVNGIDYIQVTSTKAPPSFLSLLVERFGLGCRHKRKIGIACSNFNAMTVEDITRATIKITFEADWYNWTEPDHVYYKDDLSAVFHVLT